MPFASNMSATSRCRRSRSVSGAGAGINGVAASSAQLPIRRHNISHIAQPHNCRLRSHTLAQLHFALRSPQISEFPIVLSTTATTTILIPLQRPCVPANLVSSVVLVVSSWLATYAYSPSQVRHDLHDLVTRLHHLRVQLERPLRRDQIDQLVHRLHIRRFQETLPDVAVAVLPRVVDERISRCVGLLIQVVSQLQQAVRVDELRQLNLPNDLQVGRILRAVLEPYRPTI